MNEEIAKKLALGLAAFCVRNTSLENLHAGISPEKSGQCTDGIVVETGNQKISWSEVSRISDAEMKELMQEVVNKIYTVLLRLDDPKFVAKFDALASQFTAQWNEPEELKDWFSLN